MAKTPPLEELLEFPTRFTFRVVADHQDSLEADVRGRVESVLGRPAVAVSSVGSSQGAFTSIRVTVVATTADEIRSVYAELQGVAGIRMLL